MEEKKFDLNSLIGFILIGIIIVYMLYQNAPTEEELQERAKQEQIDQEEEDTGQPTLDLSNTQEAIVANPADSAATAAAQNALGAFAYSAGLPSATEKD